ncbi:MAG: aminotransferase class V-fold PLP-dependent enzyme [Myxococcales bacterium]|jgi:selenocysteine lyase/cysteine desulfurase
MRMRRREFVTLTGGTALAACAPKTAATATTTPAASVDGWAAVRAEFDQDPDYSNMTGFLMMPNPRPVREAIAARRAELDRNPALVIERQFDLARSEQDSHEERARKAAAAFIAVPPGEVALTDSTTMGLGLVYNGLRLAAGKEVVVDNHSHYSTFEALRLRARRDGVGVRNVDLYAQPATVSVDEVVSRLRSALRPETRLVALTWVHSSTGVKMPVRAIADALAEVNGDRDEADRVLLSVDGVHGFGVEDATMPELGCDVFIAGCHKWICGPRGTGIVWARPEVWSQVVATIPAFEGPNFAAWMNGRQPEGPGGLMNTPGGFHSFENRWSLASAFEFQVGIGRAAIQDRIHALNTRLKQGLVELPAVRLHTPRDPALSCGINCFEVEGHAPGAIVEALLKERIVASTSPYRVSYARLAPSLLNDERQVDEAVKAVAALR